MSAKAQMYACPICGERQRTREKLRKHVKKLHQRNALEIDDTYRISDSVFFLLCEACPMAFSTADDMEMHDKYAHSDKTLKELRDYTVYIGREYT